MRKGENTINTELTIFNSEQFGEIRTLLIDGEPWFVGKDLSKALGYVRVDTMYKRVDEEDRQEIDPQSIEITRFLSNSGTLEPNVNVRRMTIVNESGLYCAIFGSTLKEARKFTRWVTSEVLPAIRKTGKYNPSGDLKDSLKQVDYTTQIRQIAKYGSYEDFCQMLNPALIAIGNYLGIESRKALSRVYQVYEMKHGISIGEIKERRIFELSQRKEDREDLKVFIERSASVLKMIYDMPELNKQIIDIIKGMIQEFDLYSKVEKFTSVYLNKISDTSTRVYLGWVQM